jgi:hypothetical protein
MGIGRFVFFFLPWRFLRVMDYMAFLGRLCKFVGFFSQIVPSLRRARDRVNHGNVFLLWSLAMLFELRILRV